MDQPSKSLPSIVAEQIEADFIVKGARQPGDPLPPIRRMAKRYSVSPATVADRKSVV